MCTHRRHFAQSAAIRLRQSFVIHEEAPLADSEAYAPRSEVSSGGRLTTGNKKTGSLAASRFFCQEQQSLFHNNLFCHSRTTFHDYHSSRLRFCNPHALQVVIDRRNIGVVDSQIIYSGVVEMLVARLNRRDFFPPDRLRRNELRRIGKMPTLSTSAICAKSTV